MKSKNNFGLWCLSINCVITKLFIDYPAIILGETGSAAVLTQIFSLAVFAAVLIIIYYFRHYIALCLKNNYVRNLIFTVVAAYLICSIIFYLYRFITILNKFGYTDMSVRWMLIVIGIVILFIGTKNQGAIVRLHGICIPIVILGLIALLIYAVRFDDVYNMLPIFGNGVMSIIGSGFKNVFAFSEVIIPIALVYLSKDEYMSGGRIVLSAITGAVIYSVFSSVFYLAIPANYVNASYGTALFQISELTGIQRLNSRLDAVNIVISVISAVLYLSAAVALIKILILKIGFKEKIIKKAPLVLIAVVSVMTLCSCGSRDDVEDTAFAIAVGIDLDAERGDKIFTFQFTNPLSTGENMGTGKETKEEEEKNSSVNNISVNGENVYDGIEKIKRYMGKTPSLSHMKLLVLSEDAVKDEGLINTLSNIMRIKNVSSETVAAMTDGISAKEYLEGVNPSLEESTARYYELLFSEKSTVDAVQTNLRSLIRGLTDFSGGGYLPMVSEEGFTGTVLFSRQQQILKISPHESQLINLLLGKIKTQTYYTDDKGDVFSIKAPSKAPIKTQIIDNNVYADVSLSKTEFKNSNADEAAVPSEIINDINRILHKIYYNNCDILSIRKYLKTKFFYQYEWEAFCSNDLQISVTVQ